MEDIYIYILNFQFSNIYKRKQKYLYINMYI